MDKSVPKYLAYISIAIIFIVFDQITKLAAYNTLLGQPAIDVLPVLQWVLVFNKGAAFGFLDNAGGIQHYFFSTLAILVSLVLLVWLWRCFEYNKILAWSLVLILAGATGNLLDRLQYQFVIDFIHFHYKSFSFPVFNVADICITFGAILLIIDHFQIFRKKT